VRDRQAATKLACSRSAGLVAKFDAAIKLGEDRERLADPHGPLGATMLGERTGGEIVRALQAALADVDAEIKRVG
jgi:hypothetical protein